MNDKLTEKEKERERVCVCVCGRERERERERQRASSAKFDFVSSESVCYFAKKEVERDFLFVAKMAIHQILKRITLINRSKELHCRHSGLILDLPSCDPSSNALLFSI